MEYDRDRRRTVALDMATYIKHFILENGPFAVKRMREINEKSKKIYLCKGM